MQQKKNLKSQQNQQANYLGDWLGLSGWLNSKQRLRLLRANYSGDWPGLSEAVLDLIHLSEAVRAHHYPQTRASKVGLLRSSALPNPQTRSTALVPKSPEGRHSRIGSITRYGTTVSKLSPSQSTST